MAPAAPDTAVLADLDGLRALARSLVHVDAEADDLLQDTAIAALEHPPATDRPVRPWLAAVLRNRWRMDRRGDARRRAREDAVREEGAAPAADELLERARLLERLAQALVALDEPFRATVMHRYLDGKSAAEIARAQGVPAGTVRWRLAEGLARLRAALDESRPRAAWMRALAPIALVEGATIMKAKSSLMALIALALIAGGAAIAVYVQSGARGTDARKESEQSLSSAAGGRGPFAHAPIAPIAPGGSAVAEPRAPKDPLPGQGKAFVEAAPLPGGAVAGRVINWSSGEGVAGAELTFTGDAGATTIRTNPDGVFALAPPAPGRFVLAAVAAPGFLPYAPEWSHSTIHVALERDRRVAGVTIFLFPALDYHGKVVDARGAPVSGAHVALLGTPAGEQQADRLATEWTTDRDGAFVFHAADEAVLEASANGAHGWARLDGGVAITKQLTITLGDHAARDLEIRGKVVDESDHSLPDVLVRALPADPANAKARAPAFATTGPDGAFTLAGLDDGLYDLDASDASDEGDRAPAFARAVAGGTKDVALTLTGGAALAGTVATKDGAPVPAFTLIVTARDGAARPLVLARSIVDPAGRFAVHVAAGDYDVTAAAAGSAPSAPLAVHAPAVKLALEVSTGATLVGTVVSKQDGKGIPYARVMREAIGGGASAQPANAGTVTRTDGSFELTGLPPGKLAITIGADSFHPRIEAGLTADDGATVGPITIALSPLAPGEEPTLELVGIGVALVAGGTPATSDSMTRGGAGGTAARRDSTIPGGADADALVVTRVIAGGGAEAAGIVVGDRVVAVDGAPVTTLGLEGAIAQIRGNPGTTVTISLRRGKEIVSVAVERRPLHS